MRTITLRFGLLGPVEARYDDHGIPSAPAAAGRTRPAAPRVPTGRLRRRTAPARLGGKPPGPPPRRSTSTSTTYGSCCATWPTPRATPRPDWKPTPATLRPGELHLHTAPDAVDATRLRHLLADGEAAQAAGTSAPPSPTTTPRCRCGAANPRRPPALRVRTQQPRRPHRNPAGPRKTPRDKPVGAGLHRPRHRRTPGPAHPAPRRRVLVALLAHALCASGATTRALRLVTDELDQWQREHGFRPPVLQTVRDDIVHGGIPAAP
ncbi:hypothetical protein NKH77_13660 [Streptomyces sp. M19]